jgi:hypothetical protein
MTIQRIIDCFYQLLDEGYSPSLAVQIVSLEFNISIPDFLVIYYRNCLE